MSRTEREILKDCLDAFNSISNKPITALSKTTYQLAAEISDKLKEDSEDISQNAIHSLVMEFRQWEKDWNLFDKHRLTKKPPSLEKFIRELQQKYVVMILDFKM